MFTVDELARNHGITPRQVEFYMLIGLCVKAWTTVEDELFQLVGLAINGHPQHVAIVYFRTPTIDARLKLADELIRTILPKRAKNDGGHDHPEVMLWKGIQSDIVHLLPTRNLLAHSPVRRHVVRDTSDNPASLIRLRRDGTGRDTLLSSDLLILVTSDNEQMRGKGGTFMFDTSLINHLESVKAVSKRLSAFRKRRVRAQREAPVQPATPRTSGSSRGRRRSRQKT